MSVAAREPEVERRHRLQRVLVDQRGQRVDVVGLERRDVTVEQLRRRPRPRRPRRLGRRQRRAGPLERAVHRRDRRLEQLGDLGGPPVEHLAEDQHGALSRRQHAAARRRTRVGSSRASTVTSAGSGIGSIQVASGRCSGSRPPAPARGRGPSAGARRPPGAQHVEADVRRDPVEPRAQRRPRPRSARRCARRGRTCPARRPRRRTASRASGSSTRQLGAVLLQLRKDRCCSERRLHGTRSHVMRTPMSSRRGDGLRFRQHTIPEVSRVSRTLLLIGTRKGCSCWRATTSGATGRCAGRSAKGGPSTTPSTTRARARSTPPPRASGTARPSGGAPTWARRGRTRARASPTRRRRAEDVEGLDARRVQHGRVLVGVEAPGIFESRRRRRDLVAADDARRPARQRGLGRPGEPAAGPPRHLRADVRPRGPRASGRSCRASALFETTDDGTSWTPRNRGLRADWPRAARGGRLLRPQARPLARRRRPHVPAEPRRHAPQRRRRRTAGRRSPRACRPSSASPPPRIRTTATRSTSSRSTRGHGALHARRPRVGLAHARRRLELAAARQRACRTRTRTRRAARGDGDRRLRRRRASTSARARARCSRAPTRARAGARSRATCRRSRRSRSRSSTSRGRRPPAVDADAALPGAAAPRRRRGRDGGRRRSTELDDALAGPARPAVRARPGPPPAHPRLRRPGAGGARHAARAAARAST